MSDENNKPIDDFNRIRRQLASANRKLDETREKNAHIEEKLDNLIEELHILTRAFDNMLDFQETYYKMMEIIIKEATKVMQNDDEGEIN